VIVRVLCAPEQDEGDLWDAITEAMEDKDVQSIVVHKWGARFYHDPRERDVDLRDKRPEPVGAC
jgi:hypothetical protein